MIFRPDDDSGRGAWKQNLLDGRSGSGSRSAERPGFSPSFAAAGLSRLLALTLLFVGAPAALSAQSLAGFLMTDDTLLRITLGTAETEEVAMLAEDRYSGLAFDSGEQLWTIDTEDVALVRLSTTDGSVQESTLITGLPDLSRPDLIFDACGRLWVTSTTAEDAVLYSLDPTTGVATRVGETGVEVTSLTSRGSRLVALTFNEGNEESQLVNLDPLDASSFDEREIETVAARAWIDFSVQGSLWGVSPTVGVGPPLPATVWTADSDGGGRNVVSESFELTVVRGFALAPTQGSCTATACIEGSRRACALDDRFQVTVDWQTASSSGAGRVADAKSDDSAIFTFFDPDNWEVLVKVLDGCGVNGFNWVYFAATTDVQFELEVVDTATGAVRTYESPGGMPAETVTDSAAFPCTSP